MLLFFSLGVALRLLSLFFGGTVSVDWVEIPDGVVAAVIGGITAAVMFRLEAPNAKD